MKVVGGQQRKEKNWRNGSGYQRNGSMATAWRRRKITSYGVLTTSLADATK